MTNTITGMKKVELLNVLSFGPTCKIAHSCCCVKGNSLPFHPVSINDAIYLSTCLYIHKHRALNFFVLPWWSAILIPEFPQESFLCLTHLVEFFLSKALLDAPDA